MIMLVAVFALGLSPTIFAQDDNVDGNGKHSRKNKGDKEAREEKKEQIKENRENQKEQAKENREAKRDKVEGDRESRRENYIDRRQDNQERRIQHGIDKGYLTQEETLSLKSEQNKIADMENSYKSDGKLSKDEMKSLRDELNVASCNIWAEKHDTDGKQMATFRFGKNVFAKESFTSAMANQNMTGAEAKALTSDFRKMMALKSSLANDNLSADERSKKQSEYNELLNKYFEIR